jgi:DNA repair exonuclease SbcCD ATPase subunit
MKLNRLHISNILGIRTIDAQLPAPINLFAGANGSGKSNLFEAIRMALTGETVRAGLKKNYGQLVAEGQEAGVATVEWTGGSASTVLPSGKRRFGSDAPVSGAMPYVLDAQRFARLPAGERHAFLFGLMGLKTDGTAIKERLTARGCDASMIKLVAPFLAAGFESGQKEAQAKAREAKAAWRTTTGETYGSNKAAEWAARKPETFPENLKREREKANSLASKIEGDQRHLGELQGFARQAKERAENSPNCAKRQTATPGSRTSSTTTKRG